MTDKQEKVIGSFITKEEFITLLSNINFIAVREYSIELIKEFLITENEDVKPLTIQVSLDKY